MVELLQIHLMAVHTTKGVARPRVIATRMGAQIKKRKIGKTPPENFDSICFSCKLNFSGIVLGYRKPTQKEAICLLKNANGSFVHKTDVLE
jgi:hypothetical protein